MSKFYTIEEVSELINVPADVIREWITEGKASASRRAGDVVLRHHEVQRLLAEYGENDDSAKETGNTDIKSGSLDSSSNGYIGGSAQNNADDPASYYGYPNPEPEPEPEPEETEKFKPPTAPTPPSGVGASPAKLVLNSRAVAIVNSIPDGPIDGDATVSISAPITFESLVGTAPALDYSSFYDRELDEYESQLRYLEMELPLRPSSSENGSAADQRVSTSNLDGRNAKGSEDESISAAQLEHAIERTVEPLARAQARLIKLFNESREESRRPTALPAPGGSASDKALARIEEKLAKMQSKLETPTESNNKPASLLAENVTNSLRQELASLRTFCAERFTDINAKPVAPSQEIIDSLKEIKASVDRLAAKQDPSSISVGLSSLQKKYDLLTQKYNNLRIEHERMAQEHSAVSEAGADVDDILNRLEVLRAPLDAYGLEVGDFMEKIVSHIDELSTAKRDLVRKYSDLEKNYSECEARYEACEEESSAFQVLVGNLQQENRTLKDELDNLEAENSKAKEELVELENLRETCLNLQHTASGSDEAFTKLQEEYLGLQEQNKDLLRKLQSADNELKDTLLKMQEGKSDSAAAAAALQSELSSREEALRDFEARIEELSIQLGKTIEDYEASSSELNEMKSLLGEAKEEAEEARSQLAQANEAYNDLSEAYKQKEEEAKGAKAELLQLQTVVRSTRAQSAELENMAAEAHKEASEALAKLKEAENRLEEAEKDFEAQQVKTEEVEASREELREQLSLAQRETEELLAKAQEESQQALELMQSELEAARAKAEASAIELAQQIESMAAKDKAIMETSARMESEKVRLLRRINTLQAKNEALQAEIEESHELGNSYESAKVVELQDRLEAVTFELNETKDKLKEYEERGATDGSGSLELEEALNQLQTLKSENDELRYELSVRDNADDLHKQSAEMLEAIANFEAENAEKDRLIEESHQDRARLREELERVKQSLFEQQQLYERERKEWSEILAKQVKGEGVDTGVDSPRRSGFKLFRNRGGSI
ncbi:MAG: hypothetical protein ACI38Q_03250 [Candidatus Bruticola sp.]